MVQAIRSVLRASDCANCRYLVLRTFTTIAGVPVHTTQPRSSPSQALWSQRNRFYAATANAAKEPESHRERNAENNLAEISQTVKPTHEQSEYESESTSPINETNQIETASIPWYLQVDAPLRETRSLSERQRIPDLPESSPDILQPLLQQISVDLGLDDLTILDLRDLDPPPALGANLLMIIGTARSEKHLHVSADRLCRWLRSNYKLRPEADGLLGRNELKLKLKRKARRSKLMGNKITEDMDDGVRTGWVCVNVGTVDGPVNSKSQKKDFIGFGRQTEGVKLVVQMLVEDKRQEIDLEKLWTGISNRQLLPEEEDMAALDAPQDQAFKPITTTSPSIGSLRQSSVQTRGFHTSACYRMSSVSALASTSNLSRSQQPNIVVGLNDALKASYASMLSGDFNKARMVLIQSRDSIMELKGEGWRLYMLQNLKQYLESVVTEDALLALGSGADDHASTPFLSSFYQAISNSPGPDEWEYLVWLYCFANDIGQAGYDTEKMRNLVESMILSGTEIKDHIWLAIVKTMVEIAMQPKPTLAVEREVPNEIVRENTTWSDNFLQLKSMQHVAQVLEHMEVRGIDVMSEDMFMTIQEAITANSRGDNNAPNLLWQSPTTAENYHMPSIRTPKLQVRLNELMFKVVHPIKSENARIRLMQIYARQNDWRSFWRFWRSIPRLGEPRSAALYATLFHLVANVGHQRGCMTVLRNWIPDMDKEEPPVVIAGSVREGIEACLRIVDPEAEQAAQHEAVGEWVNLWRRCQAAPS